MMEQVDSWRDSIAAFSCPSDLLSPSVVLERPFSVSILDRPGACLMANGHLGPGIRVYTDGSRFTNSAGAGFVVFIDGMLVSEQSFSLVPMPQFSSVKSLPFHGLVTT